MLKKNPRKVPWTQVYRKLHKKDAGSDAEKKKRVRRAQKSQRAIVGASLEAIRAKKVRGIENL
jgi:large subunit ribosomal protein L24e